MGVRPHDAACCGRLKINAVLTDTELILIRPCTESEACFVALLFCLVSASTQRARLNASAGKERLSVKTQHLQMYLLVNAQAATDQGFPIV